LNRAVADDSPRVRLEAVVAAAKVPSPDAIKVALKVLDKPMDSYIERALWLAVQATKRQWFPSVAGNVGVKPSGDHPANVPPLLTQPSPRSGESSSAPLKSSAPGAPEGFTPTDPAMAFRSFLADMPAPHIVFLVKREGSKELRELCTAMLTQSDLPANVREGLTLALAKDDSNADALTPTERKQLTAAKDADKLAALAQRADALLKLRIATLAKLVSTDEPRAGRLVAAMANSVTDTEALRQWLAPVLPVEAASKALVAALKEKPCTADTAKLIMRVLTSTGRSEPELMTAMTSILGASSPVPSYSPEFVSTLVAEVKAKGNADRGKAVFNSTLTNCTACHSIAKKGGTIGPELDAVGRGVPMELLVEAVVWPNRQIKEGYIATLIKTKDGRVLQGYKVSDANGELQLRDLLSKTVTTFAANEIDTRTDSGSLMPEGLVALMTREELRDLIAYLMTLGR
jgi:putative heme-binding domain-containing protein